jgi:hypothetical protein
MKGMAAVVAPAEGAPTERARRPRWLPRIALARRVDKPPAEDTPPPPQGDAIEPTIYRFILKHSFKQQMMLLILTLVSFPFLYYSLDLPKTITNQAINGKGFPKPFVGLSLDQVPYLLALCGIFLCLVFINGAFKY